MKNNQSSAIEPKQISSEPLELGSDQDVANELGISRCTVWRYADKGIIPPAIKISPGTTRFDMKAIRRVIAARAVDGTLQRKKIRCHERQDKTGEKSLENQAVPLAESSD